MLALAGAGAAGMYSVLWSGVPFKACLNEKDRVGHRGLRVIITGLMSGNDIQTLLPQGSRGVIQG